MPNTDPYPSFERASGLCICDSCQQLYRKHPHAEEWKDWSGNPWLRRLCDGSLVKL